jgi:hypothetical protein
VKLATEKPPDPGNEKAAVVGGSLKTGNYYDSIQQEQGVKPRLAGRISFLDPCKESAVVGTITTGLFNNIPESHLNPPKAFTDRKCQIIYGAAYSLRRAGIPVCVERVSDLIAENRLDGELQRLLAPSNTVSWREWPDFFDQSLAFSGTAAVEYSLEVLGELYEKREAAAIAKRMEAGELSPKEAIEALYEIAPHTRGLPPMVSAKELCSKPPPTPPEIIEGVLHQGGKMALGGGSKTFKTWNLLHLAICIAGDRYWLGFPTAEGPVLYLNFELPAFSIEKRIREICDEMDVEVPEDLVLLNLRGHATDAAVILPVISREAKARNFAPIIVDPLYKLLGNRDENASRDMADLMNVIERLTVETGAAAAFGSHFAKGNASQKEPMDRISGSGVFARDPDSIVTLTAHEQKDCFSVEMTLRNFPPQEAFVVRRQHPLMVRDEKLDPSKLKQVGGRKKEVSAADVLGQLGDEALSYGEWRKRCEEKLLTSTSTFKRKLRDLRETGHIRETTEGKYVKA